MVLKGRDQKEVEGEALACARGSENEGVAHVPGEKVIVIWGAAAGFQDGQGGPAQVFADGPAPGGTEDGSQAGQQSGRCKDAADVASGRLAGQPAEPGRELAVSFPDHLGVIGVEDPPDFGVQAVDPLIAAMERNGAGDRAVGDAVCLQLDQSAAQAAGFGLGRGVGHGGGGSLGLLHVGGHGVALREVVALGAADLSPGGVKPPSLPLQAYGRGHVQSEKVCQEVGLGLPGRGQHGVDQHGLTVQAEKAPLGLQLRYGELPVEAAACGSAPRCSGTVHQLGEKAGAFLRAKQLNGGDVGNQGAAGGYRLAELLGGRFHGPAKVDDFIGLLAPGHPMAQPGCHSAVDLGAGRLKPRLVAPGNVDGNIGYASGQELAPPLLGQPHNLAGVTDRFPDLRGPAEKVEVKAHPVVQIGQGALPAVDDAVQVDGRAGRPGEPG